jgi:hypothetical protein
MLNMFEEEQWSAVFFAIDFKTAQESRISP